MADFNSSQHRTSPDVNGVRRILVIEDNAGLNRLVCKALSHCGAEIEGCMTGTEALAAIRRQPTTLLLLDYQLPDMNGKSLIEEMSREANPVPFIIMTGHGDQALAVEMMKIGARHYLVKEGEFIDILPDIVRRTLEELESENNLKLAHEEKSKLEEQLRQAQKMEAVGTLAAGVAHDFNNLLTSIHGYTTLALDELPPDSKMFKQLQTVQRCAERAAALTRQLLLFSRNESPHLSAIDLNGTISEMLKMLRRLIGEDVKVVADMSQQACIVMADAGNIEQVIMNLAVNARDAMPGGGELTVTTFIVNLAEEDCRGMPQARPGAYVCLSVNDTGTGMDKATLERIFDPFFTTKEAGKGTGLGLAVVYGIVTMHKGWIHVYSEPGQGTTFNVYLPICNQIVESGEDAGPSLSSMCGKGEGVLVVEDDESMREWCVIALGDSGYTVFEAQNAREALEIFGREQNNISAIISDVVMPGTSGFQLVQQLVQQKPALKIIMSSGYTGERSGCSLVKEKGYGFLQKPYTMVQLLQTLQQAFNPPKAELQI